MSTSRPNMTLCKEVGEWPILGPGPHDRQRPAWGQTHTPTPRNPALCPQNPPHFIPTLQPHAIIASLPLPDGSRTFRCKWEGMPPGLARKRQRGRREEAKANAVPLAGGPFKGRAKPATGPGSVSCLTGGVDHRSRACGGHGAFFASGPCRNTRPKHLSRPVQAAAGATRAEGPEEGQVDKPAPCVCKASACRMGTPSGDIRAARCQRHPGACRVQMVSFER
ncbi:hypothetical protein HPDFL43_00028710 [Hoeflea phototrophica DFL-43]|uniref:Uncharacterized protein n=1 Tax=Hoeflea phototrophica (strain DSM 17068 / NCIMB 14078 / DFL-43) TaxID=411684 RepID=A0A094YYI4_HOEPD|nr:hypothetical protein HPDFL43_00028710 [Hoeflea phototrophica DFL-43]